MTYFTGASASTKSGQGLKEPWTPWSSIFPTYRTPEQRRLRRVGLAWSLLFFNVLGATGGSVLHIPHSVEQILTQGALGLALIVALTVNPRVRVKPNMLLTLYSLLACLSLTTSLGFVRLGTDYRALRLAGFVAVLWLLTPWWGADGSILLRSQLRFVAVILTSVVLGALVNPGAALSGGRLSDVLWSSPPTQVAHFAAELSGLTILMWICGRVPRRSALLVVAPTLTILLLTHTRTALIGEAAGLIVAGLSLFTASRRVRRVFGATVVIVALVGIPASPFIVNFLARGENSTELTSLTGRTSHWAIVFNEQRPLTDKLLGSGMSNDFAGGEAIDSTWVDVYQNQGLVGDVIVGTILLSMLLLALFRPRGPARAIALYLIVYCVFASFTEDGLGEASQYMLDMVLAASLLVPSRAALTVRLPRWLSGDSRPIGEPLASG